ncbi:MAG: hypothetical protein GC154_15875 [bacterium]|nr:hypothetical protein [bacterium]
MKIQPLFHPGGPGHEADALEMIRMLDIPDDAPARRAFEARCAESDERAAEWEGAVSALSAGKSLRRFEPPAAIRNAVLEAARGERVVIPLPEARKPGEAWRLPGWRWAWAAIFLVFLWGGFMESQKQSEPTIEPGQLDAELLTLDQEMDSLMTDLEFDLESALQG